jgi:hypothetical protein
MKPNDDQTEELRARARNAAVLRTYRREAELARLKDLRSHLDTSVLEPAGKYLEAMIEALTDDPSVPRARMIGSDAVRTAPYPSREREALRRLA